ncbi:hypothetical protein J6590_022892 [Homalodisca vitripennis]|nr:hypothetical protein J6590_022892 [Homalodisca vitripennis]
MTTSDATVRPGRALLRTPAGFDSRTSSIQFLLRSSHPRRVPGRIAQTARTRFSTCVVMECEARIKDASGVTRHRPQVMLCVALEEVVHPCPECSGYGARLGHSGPCLSGLLRSSQLCRPDTDLSSGSVRVTKYYRSLLLHMCWCISCRLSD